MESLGIGLANQQLEPFQVKIEPGAENLDDPISHPGEEFIYCLCGELEYIIDEQVFHLEPGDSLLFDAVQRHAYCNPGQLTTTILLVLQASRDLYRVHQLHMA
jgi:quercetin dioxygenase-like cupin family protein